MPTYNYSPFLRWKAGERDALTRLSNATKATIKPLILLGSEQFLDTKSPRKKPLKRPPKRPPPPGAVALVEQVAKAWGNGSVYLDASGLPSTGDKHHLDRIAEKARAASLQILPAASVADGDHHWSAVERVHATDRRGAALRVGLADMTTLAAWVDDWVVPVPETDLFVDLTNTVRNVAALGVPLLDAFAKLHLGATWRSVTVVGGSIPQMLTGFKVGSTPIPRSELKLWRDLSAYGLPFQIHFGDYATVAPDALTIDVEGSFPINAKYTLPASFFVRHGVRPKGEAGVDRDVQFRGHAAAIVGLADRARLENCWGDSEIDRIAAGVGSAGSPTTWVAYAINRHIEITRLTLP